MQALFKFSALGDVSRLSNASEEEQEEKGEEKASLTSPKQIALYTHLRTHTNCLKMYDK